LQTRVQVEHGLLEGFEEGGIGHFFGIPYAAPPVGDLRWCPPASPERWEGVREAKKFSRIAIQTMGASFTLREPEQSEDCLYLNVWTATTARDAKQPVMVWIHGGGNLGGAGSEDAFDGAALAKRGVTVITFNYRLGALGFIAHPSIGANFAVLDYVAVLRWVEANIAGFGGDPGNVTIFGESAGAVAVRALLACPSARGLFHRAIMQSAGFERYAFAPGWSYERASSAAEGLFDRLGSRDITELRKVPIADVKLASHELSGVLPKPGQVQTPANLVWMPVPDGEIVFDEGFPGWPADVPVMIGCVENEARYFLKPGGAYPPDLLQILSNALCGPRSADIMALFAKTGDEQYESLDKLFSTVIWFEPALATTQRFHEMGRNFFYYHFARVSPGARDNDDLARHTSEIRYIFGNLTEDGFYDETDAAISDALQNAWVEFARTGVPHSPDGSAWPLFAGPTPQYTWIGDALETRPFEISELTTIVHSLRD
jgi:para-nitrobenzyl esterase